MNDMQPVPEQLLPPGQLPPAYIQSMTSYGIEYPFGQFAQILFSSRIHHTALHQLPERELTLSQLKPGHKATDIRKRPWCKLLMNLNMLFKGMATRATEKVERKRI